MQKHKTWRSLLGILWILDGLLQLQPAMFGSQFIRQVLDANLMGQPGWFSPILRFSYSSWAAHPLLSDLGAALFQVAIGILLLLPKKVWYTRGLWLSLSWGALVWIMGEGLGSMATASASFVTGSPGSAILYVALTVLLLLPIEWWESGRIGPIAGRIVGTLWLWGAILQTRMDFFQAGGLLSPWYDLASSPQPPIIASVIQQVVAHLAHVADWTNVGFIVIMAGLGIAYLLDWHPTWLRFSVGLWLLTIWWLAMDFGVLGGVGTDPNTPPIWILLMALPWLWHPDQKARTVTVPQRRRLESPIKAQ